jgi:membrane protein implicated in regulation of membrane protease activity
MVVPGALYAWWGSQANDIATAMNETRDWTYWTAMGASLILTIWVIYYLRKITLTHIEASSEPPAGMVQEP